MKKIYLSVVFIFVFCLGFSQTMVSTDSPLKKYMIEVKEKVSQGDFQSADKSLKKVFKLKTVLPDEVAYYYGYIQIKLKNFSKGKEGLQKYIQLTEGVGEHYTHTLSLLDEANSSICKICNNTNTVEVKDTCSVCIGLGKVEEQCDQCKLSGQEVCYTCKGKGVLVNKNSLGTSYAECATCKGKGLVNCQSCGGTKKKLSYCSNCKGVGFFKKKVRCEHN